MDGTSVPRLSSRLPQVQMPRPTSSSSSAMIQHPARGWAPVPYRYPEFPEHFVYRDKKRWPRKKGEGNQAHVPVQPLPRGAVLPASAADRPTASTQLLGLLRRDREWSISFEQIAVFASGHSPLRSLFIFVLLHGSRASCGTTSRMTSATTCLTR